MEIVVPEGMAKKEWFSPAEVADGVKVSRAALVEWIRVHPKFRQEFCQKVGVGEKRPRFLIHWKGISEYFAQKSKTHRGNRYSKSLDPRDLETAKSNVAQMANQTIERQHSQSLPADPILANLQMMIEMRQSQLALGTKVEILEKKLEETMAIATTPVPVTNGQRQFLNERVRKYCIEHDLPFHVVWRQVHEHVGLAAVHKYELRHYQAALKYVEKMYRETGLIW